MRFLAFLDRPGADSERRSARLASLAEAAAGAGLERLEHEGQKLPVWVEHRTAWRVLAEPKGRLLVAPAADAPGPARPFRELLTAPRRGPLLLLGEEAGAAGGSVASDQLGLSTTYYRDLAEGLVCASRSGWLVPRADRKLNLLAAYHFLNFMVVPSPHSILEGVSRLAPGVCATVGSPGTSLETYWDLTYAPNGVPPGPGLPRALFEKIREAVERSVAGSNGAETGAFLSGGTDSTTVAAFAAQALGGRLDVFSIVFESSDYSEEPFVRAAAQRFPFRVNTFLLDQISFVRAIEPIQETYDEPYSNSSAYAAYYCFDMARQGGKRLLLGGDGGDEIFGGNERYAKNKIFAAYNAVPRWLRAAWEGPLGRAGTSLHLVNRLRKGFRRAALANPDRFYADDEFASAHWDQLRGPVFLDATFPRDASLAHLRGVYQTCRAEAELDRLLYLDMKGAIADNDLRKIVGCGSIFDMEARFPFLDLELVEFANHLPPELKVKGLKKRYLFKQAMKGFLPDVILFKRKHGMGVPVTKWLREDGPLTAFVRARLRADSAAMLFNKQYVEQLWVEHRRGQWDHSDSLWRLVVLSDWLERHGVRDS